MNNQRISVSVAATVLAALAMSLACGGCEAIEDAVGVPWELARSAATIVVDARPLPVRRLRTPPRAQVKRNPYPLVAVPRP